MQVHHQNGHVVHLRGVDLADQAVSAPHPYAHSSLCGVRAKQPRAISNTSCEDWVTNPVQARHASTKQKQHQIQLSQRVETIRA